MKNRDIGVVLGGSVQHGHFTRFLEPFFFVLYNADGFSGHTHTPPASSRAGASALVVGICVLLTHPSNFKNIPPLICFFFKKYIYTGMHIKFKLNYSVLISCQDADTYATLALFECSTGQILGS
eukprot:SAG31_NODE_421_length_15868_cov_8.966453_3_plen_124_part_00